MKTCAVLLLFLLRGKTLPGKHGGNLPGNGPLGFALNLCPDGAGLDVRRLFMDPVPRFFDETQLATRCMKSTRAHPLTGLTPLLSALLIRNAGRAGENESAESAILRHLYWVN